MKDWLKKLTRETDKIQLIFKVVQVHVQTKTVVLAKKTHCPTTKYQVNLNKLSGISIFEEKEKNEK